MQDGAADDNVECGGGHDTVYFDQEFELVSPDECEEQNPVPNTLHERRDGVGGTASGPLRGE